MKKRRLIGLIATRIIVETTRLLRQTADKRQPSRILRLSGFSNFSDRDTAPQARTRCSECERSAAADPILFLSLGVQHVALQIRARLSSLTPHCERGNQVHRLRILRLILCAATGMGIGHGLQADTIQWCSTTAGAFHLISDLPAAEQRDLIEYLDRFERVSERFLPGEPVARRTALKLILFRQRADFRRLTGKRQFAGYMQPSLQTNRLLIGPLRGGLMETTQHEYAHYLLRNRTGISLPMWFDEGLASLLGQTEIENDVVQLGRLPVKRLLERVRIRERQRSPQYALRAALETTSMEGWSQDRIDAFYDWSLLLVHYLYFETYRDALLEDSIRSSPLEQFLADGNETLPDHLNMSERRLLKALERHLKRWNGFHPEPAPESAQLKAEQDCLVPLSRDLELARAIHMQNAEQARRLLTAYLPAEQNNVELLVILARAASAADQHQESQRLLEDALKLAPQHPEASVLNANLLVRDCLFQRHDGCQARWQEAAVAYRTALRRDPTRYDGILGLGLAHLHSGRPGDAVNYLRVAYERAPWAAVINYYLGESLRLVGDSEASVYLQNARNWAESDFWRLVAEESLRLEILSRSDPG